jgi:hypothetical protein
MFKLFGLFIGLVGLVLLLPSPALGLGLMVLGFLVYAAASNAHNRALAAHRHKELIDAAYSNTRKSRNDADRIAKMLEDDDATYEMGHDEVSIVPNHHNHSVR